MSVVTLATSLTTATDPFHPIYTYSPESGGNRLAVPLTTAWSFPAGCPSADVLIGMGSCSPPYFVEVKSYDGYYSPGVCYAGYTIGCIATAASVNFELVKADETVGFCVPRRVPFYLTCHYECETIYEGSGYQRIVYAKPPETATHLPPAYAIQVRWQSSDSAALGSLYVPSYVVARDLQGPSFASEPPSQTSQATSTNGAQGDVVTNSGLSPGHIAAIVVCVAVVVLGALMAAFIIFRRKRRQLRAAGQAPTGAPEDGQPAELPYDAEAGGKGVELPGERQFEPEPEELPAEQVVILSSTPEATVSAIRQAPELAGSSAQARMELPDEGGTQTHAGSSTTSAEPAATSTLSPATPQQGAHVTETAEDLIARQAQLEERRQRLLQLQQIEEEQERIQQQLAALHGQQPREQSGQRAGMP